jgi:hypothetical protein
VHPSGCAREGPQACRNVSVRRAATYLGMPRSDDGEGRTAEGPGRGGGAGGRHLDRHWHPAPAPQRQRSPDRRTRIQSQTHRSHNARGWTHKL